MKRKWKSRIKALESQVDELLHWVDVLRDRASRDAVMQPVVRHRDGPAGVAFPLSTLDGITKTVIGMTRPEEGK